MVFGSEIVEVKIVEKLTLTVILAIPHVEPTPGKRLQPVDHPEATSARGFSTK
jgi:hypothetical protein